MVSLPYFLSEKILLAFLALYFEANINIEIGDVYMSFLIIVTFSFNISDVANVLTQIESAYDASLRADAPRNNKLRGKWRTILESRQ